MSKSPWKTLGLTALLAAGVSLATMGGAAALTLPAPTLPSVETTTQANGLVQKAQFVIGWSYNSHRHGRRYRYRRHGYRYQHRGYWYARPWWSLQVPVPVPAPVPYARGSAHVQYCLGKYRSYNPSTDMFLGYDGYYHRCKSPY